MTIVGRTRAYSPLLLGLTGPNTIGRLERAARAPLDDARHLHATRRPFWALYTLGYAVEIVLKVAFLRLCGLGARDDFTNYLSFAKSWAVQVGVVHKARNLHDLVFWTELLIREREFMGRPFEGKFAAQLSARIQQIAKHWREDLRYWPSRKVVNETEEVSVAVTWIVQRKATLWG